MTNLFIGAAGKNRAKGKAYDAGDVRGTDPEAKKHDPQKSGFIDKFGFEGTDFRVTVYVGVDGADQEVWEVSN